MRERLRRLAQNVRVDEVSHSISVDADSMLTKNPFSGHARSLCLVDLAAAAAGFVELDARRWPSYEHLHHAALAAVHAICLGVLRCEDSGCARDKIVDVLGPVRDIHARSPFVARLQR